MNNTVDFRPVVEQKFFKQGATVFQSQFERRVGLSQIEEVVERTKKNTLRRGGVNPIVGYTYAHRKDQNSIEPTHDGGIILFFYDGTQMEIPRDTFNEMKPYNES